MVVVVVVVMVVVVFLVVVVEIVVGDCVLFGIFFWNRGGMKFFSIGESIGIICIWWFFVVGIVVVNN